MSIEPWNTGTDGAADCEDMPRKSIDRKFTDDPLREKRGNCTLFCLPARTGLGRARSWVKGWIPCGFLGQRPKPSESFSSSISTVFKVLLSLFFHGSFFIDYLTLPNIDIYATVYIAVTYLLVLKGIRPQSRSSRAAVQQAIKLFQNSSKTPKTAWFRGFSFSNPLSCFGMV